MRWLVAGVGLPIAAVSCGLGWLYLLRSGRLFALGPPVNGALALQQLARGDAQPLARDLVAWGVAGLACGALLWALARERAVRLLPLFALGSAALVVAAGAASDALVNNARVVDHLGPQLSSPGVTVALGIVVAAALLAVSARGRRTRA